MAAENVAVNKKKSQIRLMRHGTLDLVRIRLQWN